MTNPNAPCPLCGSTKLIQFEFWAHDDPCGEFVPHLRCEKCGCTAIASVWNQRRDPWRKTTEELEKESTMLDWMIQHSARVSHFADESVYLEWQTEDGDERDLEEHRRTPREAIGAAMRGEG